MFSQKQIIVFTLLENAKLMANIMTWEEKRYKIQHKLKNRPSREGNERPKLHLPNLSLILYCL